MARRRGASFWTRLRPVSMFPMAELTTEPSVVVHAKSGQRLSYGEIAGFATPAAKLCPLVSEKDLKDPSQFRLIGHEIPRWICPIKTDGSATYSIDVRLPDMVYATWCALRCWALRLASVNDAEVSKMRDVIKGDAVAARSRGDCCAHLRSGAGRRARAENQPGAKSRRSEFDSERAMEQQSAIARDLSKAGVQVQNTGDVVAALSGAAKVYKAEYRTELVYHAQLEPLNSVSWVKDGGKSVEVWAGSQTPTHLTRSVAEALGI